MHAAMRNQDRAARRITLLVIAGQKARSAV
jgi:hypothetical protein